ncbi:MAG: type II toxin-antitoxin system RelE/ParE family toxin [Azoarcus sp.]|jgi:plasmid stabilization system protein ParE|nr:type II toxin-antitoxin system RelE/ParE family toxin [Azoarcus sp.]
MPRLRVRLTRKASADLLRLAKFLVDRGAMAAAEKALAAIRKSFDEIAESPQASRQADDFDDPDIRHCRVKFGRYGYVVLYRIYPEESVVLSIKAGLEIDFGDVDLNA